MLYDVTTILSTIAIVRYCYGYGRSVTGMHAAGSRPPPADDDDDGLAAGCQC